MFYEILSTIAFIIILPLWLLLGLFRPKLVYGFKEKMGFYGKLNLPSRKTIIFYGVSVGEVIAMENLIKKTREIFPDINIIVLTGTKTGQEIAHKKLEETADYITYFPLDFSFCITNMIKKLKPDAIFVMETELWPNFANITNNKKIPTYIINARISDRTYRSYKKLSFFFAPILKKYTNIYPQSKQDSDKLISIGANSNTTEIMGNLKFDIKKPEVNELNFQKHTSNKIILAGSTHFGEEEIILKAFSELKNEFPELKLIIAPRHPNRNEKVFELIKATGFACSRRSELSSTPDANPPLQEEIEISKSNFEQNEIILLDTMGELGKFYSICDIAFMGGSFSIKGEDNFAGKGVGGHNPLEATIFNKPVVSGPSIHNFKDIYAILTSTDAGKIVKTPEELKSYLHKLLNNKKFYQQTCQDCENVFEQNKGALEFVIKVLQTIV